MDSLYSGALKKVMDWDTVFQEIVLSSQEYQYDDDDDDEWILPLDFIFSSDQEISCCQVESNPQKSHKKKEVYTPTHPYTVHHFTRLSDDRYRVIGQQVVNSYSPSGKKKKEVLTEWSYVHRVGFPICPSNKSNGCPDN
jgi:hypothetical protein